MESDLFDYAVYGVAAVIAYYMARSFFSSKTALTAQIPTPSRQRFTEKRDFKVEELKAYDGSDPTSAILMGVKGKVYDVTGGAGFYGPGGAYHAFAGKDASRALAKGIVDPIEAQKKRSRRSHF
eukprot:TRINITY_DN6680_c0_g1_i1.p1 TRINITY_DN6680_c0_g1~~TRINITY_DN6680_c0_g1_i1.p1  ORF type:complete len:124 (+),score=32.95 TRINITY_DN6680_c0_g1_i1:45-416(+)